MRRTLMAGVLVGIVSLTSVAADQAAPPSNYKHLKELEYFIGEWDVKAKRADEESDEAQQVKCEWTLNKNFQMWTITVKVKGKDDLIFRGMVGWDASTKSIKAWHFWVSGTQSESVFSKTNDGWEHMISVSLPNGKKVKAKGVFTIVDENTYRYQDEQTSFVAKRKKK